MPGDLRRLPLTFWSRPVVVARVLAYRTVLGERGEAMPALKAAADAFRGVDDDPAARACDVPLIVSAAARGDTE